jgi:hypothetical protein
MAKVAAEKYVPGKNKPVSQDNKGNWILILRKFRICKISFVALWRLQTVTTPAVTVSTITPVATVGPTNFNDIIHRNELFNLSRQGREDSAATSSQ